MPDNICYNYDDGGYYIGSEEMDIDQLETELAGEPVYLLPANATTVEPPPTGPGQRAKWDGSAWSVEADYYGVTVWHIETKASGPWPEHGPLDPEYTDLEPPYPWSGWDGSAWVYDRQQSARAVKEEARYRVEGIGEGNGADMVVWDYMVGKRIEHLIDGTPDLGAQEKPEWDRIYALLSEAKDIYRDMRAILAMDPIPDDFQDDSYWPNSPPRPVY